MFSFLVIVIAVIAAVLILVILLQSGQGSGLSGIASGGATRQVLGTRQAPDMLEKATWTLGAIFIALCVLTNLFLGAEEQESVIQNRATQQEAPAPQQGQDAAPLPGEGGGGGQGGNTQNPPGDGN